MKIKLGSSGQARIHVVSQDEKTVKVNLYFQDEERTWYKVVGRVQKDKLKTIREHLAQRR